MPKFTLKVDYPVTLGNPRSGESMNLVPGETVEAPGDLVTSRPKDSDRPPLPGDAYIVVNNDVEKAWPHALWAVVEDKPAAKASAVKEN